MNAQVNTAQSRLNLNRSFGVVALMRYCTLVVLMIFAALLPIKEARAESVVSVLFEVCDQVPGVCGKNYKPVAQGCFLETANELDCALAIISVATGGQSASGVKMVNAIVDCINAVPDLANKAKFDATCRPLLQQAGVDVGKVDEVYGIAGRCANADDVDDFIYCADTLLDSSIAKDAELGIPTWVDSLFDVYVDIDQKDYWGLVKHVGSTIACAVANYFIGADVCAFLDDIAEFAGDVKDGVVAIGGAVNNFGEKYVLGQTKHEPLPDFFNRYWLPEVDAYAQNVIVKRDIVYWNKTGDKMKHCRNYFESHTMSSDKSCRVCVDMRDGMTAAEQCNAQPVITEFPDRGFTQLASRRGAIMLLPELVRAAADQRVALLRSQGALKSPHLPGPQVQFDPWKGAQEVPEAQAFVYRLYGLGTKGEVNDLPAMNRQAKTVEEAWRTKTVGFGAYMIAQSAKVAPGKLEFVISEAIATKAIASSEAGIDIVAEVKKFVQSAHEGRMKVVMAYQNLNSTINKDNQKPLNDTLALCEPKATGACQAEVRARFKVCDAKTQAFADANQAVMGDFDNKRGQDAIKKWGEIRSTCEAEVRANVESLPNVTGDASGTQSCKLFLGRPTELLCPDAATFMACRSQVDTGKLASCRQVGVSTAYTKQDGPPASGPGTVRPTPPGSFGNTPLTVPGAVPSGFGGSRPKR